MVSIPMLGESVRLSPRALLVLKVGALVVMLADHVDNMLLDGALYVHATVGRVVFPVFAYILALNLARAEPEHLLRRVVPRMLGVGVLAQLPYGALIEWDGPLNVMFTLALAVAVASWWQLGRYIKASLWFLLAGAVVDYLWFGVGLVLLFAWMQERRTVPLWAYGVAAALLLYPINGNVWAVLLSAALLVAARVHGDAPRYKWLFYAAYPLHLYVLAAFR